MKSSNKEKTIPTKTEELAETLLPRSLHRVAEQTVCAQEVPSDIMKRLPVCF